GLAMAREFANAGAQVVIADIREDALNKAKAALPNARLARVDVTDRKALERAAAETSKVHILCANAGVFLGGPTQDATYDDWDFVMGVNLRGVVNTVQTFVPRMIAQNEG